MPGTPGTRANASHVRGSTISLEQPAQHLITILMSVPFNYLPWAHPIGVYVSRLGLKKMQ